MKTLTFLFVIILCSLEFSFAKGCTKEIHIGNNYWNSIIDTSEHSIIEGDSLRIQLRVWGGDCSNGSDECLMTSLTKLYKDSVLVASFPGEFYIGDTGNYYCTADFISCGGGGQFKVWVHVKYTTVGINEINENNNFSVYPLPAKNYISIPVNIKDLFIYDLSGKEVTHIKNPSESVDVSYFLSGYYLLVGTNKDNRKYFSKMIIE